MNFILSVLVISSYSIVVINCGTKFITDGQTYYASYPAKSSWFEAKRYCLLSGMKLIDVWSEEDHGRIKKAISYIETKHNIEAGSTLWWTCGRSTGNSGRFYWDTTGKTFHFTDWGIRQPDSFAKNEQCVHYHYSFRRWNAANCEYQMYFMCLV